LREVEHSGEKAQALAAIDSIRKGHRDGGVKGMRHLKTLSVRAAPGSRTRGLLRAGPLAFPVALGRGGILANKREGDGATPRGTYRLKRLWWRADRNPRPSTNLPLRQITAEDTWCDDPTDRRYNQPIRILPGASGDRLHREDHLYDFIIEIDHNTRPRISRRGSAVFLHLARPDLAPSAGCVTMSKAWMRALLRQIGRNSRIEIR
jgi:L,D-peptidoglycan transpeptidase YkuD (ErfK/YbiS/YcfS/YnhG family)